MYYVECCVLCDVPASSVRKISPVYDEMNASVADTGKRKMTVKRGTAHTCLCRRIR